MAVGRLWEDGSRWDLPWLSCKCVSCQGSKGKPPVSRDGPGTFVPAFPYCRQPLLMAVILVQMSKAEVTDLCKPLRVPDCHVGSSRPRCRVWPWIQTWMCVSFPWLPTTGEGFLCAKGAGMVLCCDPQTDLLSPSSRGRLLYDL